MSNGGDFHDTETVIAIIPGDVVTIRTSKAVYLAKSVIITGGMFDNT